MGTYYKEIQQYLEKFAHLVLLLDKKGVRSNTETLSLVELMLIKRLGMSPEPTMPEIMNEIGLDRNSFSSMVKKLQLQRYLIKKRSETDGRVSVLALTERGENLFQEISQMEKNLLEKILNDFSYNEERTILKFLVKVDMMKKSYK